MKTKLIRIEEVSEMTGLKKSALYQRISEKTFPCPIKLGARCSRWDSVAVQQWIENAIAENRAV